MTEKPVFPPREGDLPRDELIAAIPLAIKNLGFEKFDVDVHFKFTCQWCGERCMLQEPNMLYENGECHVCGKSTPINFGGFTLMARTTPKTEKERQMENEHKPGRIYPPWTDDQVAALREWQTTPWLHPFTCCNHGAMDVTRDGFVCKVCNSLLKWAHDFMAQPVPPNPLPRKVRPPK